MKSVKELLAEMPPWVKWEPAVYEHAGNKVYGVMQEFNGSNYLLTPGGTLIKCGFVWAAVNKNPKAITPNDTDDMLKLKEFEEIAVKNNGWIYVEE